MTWYLRWKAAPPPEPEYGLLRVACPRRLSTAEADRLSAWIIAEGRPSVEGRGGNLLYPIAECERLAKRAIQAGRRQWRGRWQER